VRSALDLRNPSEFDRFLRHCAARSGRELNLPDLARDCGVDHTTIKRWINVLEACFVVRLLRPYHNNFGKRLIKRPKLHFVDTGLACRLIRISDVDQLSIHPLRGALVESWCHNEVVKYFAHRGRHDALWFWRTNDGLEFDVLLEVGATLVPIEIKASLTPRSGAVSAAARIAGSDLAQHGLRLGRPVRLRAERKCVGPTQRTSTSSDSSSAGAFETGLVQMAEMHECRVRAALFFRVTGGGTEVARGRTPGTSDARSCARAPGEYSS